MKARNYRILSQAVETGALIGIARAYKHVEEPTHEQIAANVSREIMNEISELFVFDDEGY